MQVCLRVDIKTEFTNSEDSRVQFWILIPYKIPTDVHYGNFMLQGLLNYPKVSTGRLSVFHLKKGEMVAWPKLQERK